MKLQIVSLFATALIAHVVSVPLRQNSIDDDVDGIVDFVKCAYKRILPAVDAVNEFDLKITWVNATVESVKALRRIEDCLKDFEPGTEQDVCKEKAGEDAISAFMDFYSEMLNTGRVKLAEKVRAALSDCAVESSDENQEVETFGSKVGDHLKCVVGVIKKVSEKHRGEVKDLWNAASAQLQASLEKLKACREAGDKAAVVKCIRENLSTIKKVLGNLLRDVGAANKEALVDIVQQVKKDCVKNGEV